MRMRYNGFHPLKKIRQICIFIEGFFVFSDGTKVANKDRKKQDIHSV